MKLCWENLDKLRAFNKPGTHNTTILRYYDYPENQEGYKGTYDISEEPCLNCGNYFLAKDNCSYQFCDPSCRQVYFKNRAEERKTIIKRKLPDRRLKENGGSRPPWNKGTSLRGKVDFERYVDRLLWFAPVRKSMENGKTLQTKCCVCGTWFDPDIDRVLDVLKFAENGEGSSWGFYCSTTCKNNCPYFGKTVVQIEKNDFLNNGKALFSDRVPTPPTILYYDWQTELKKLQKPMFDKTKRLLKTAKLKRRKQTELEKARAKRKRELRKAREEREKDVRRPRLKRMIYLAKAHAKTKKLDFDIDYDWLKNNVADKCPKCGLEFSYDMSVKMNPLAPSIDRKDSKKGYTKDNCQIVSWIYNCGKNSYEEKDLYTICKAFLKSHDHDNPSGTP